MTQYVYGYYYYNKIRESFITLRFGKNDNITKAILIGIIAYLISTLFMGLSGSVFYEKDSVLAFSIAWGIMGSIVKMNQNINAT